MESDLELIVSEKSETGLEFNKRQMVMDFQRTYVLEIVEKLRCEMDKRDKILDLLVSGGDVTLVHMDLQKPGENDNDKDYVNAVRSGSKTFELLIKTVPFKVETVTLVPINWDELINSLENESRDISLFSQDVKQKPKTEPKAEPQSKQTDTNMDPKTFPLPAKRRFHGSETESESDKTATATCKNQNPPVEKQAKLDKKEKETCDFLYELPEFSMDKSFFQNQDSSTTTSKSNRKFLIRLHDNKSDSDKISVYEIFHSTSSNSVSCQKFQLSLQEITAAINAHNSSNPGSKLEIWCHIVNFDILSDSDSSSVLAQSQSRHFCKSFGKFISHFSFHQSQPSLINSNFLIGFLLHNFPNLKWLSINSEMLTNLEDLVLNSKLKLPPSPKPLKLECLKTLKILPTRKNAAQFTGSFFAKLLKRTPRLESIHGIPLHCLKEMVELDKILMKDLLQQDPLNFDGWSKSTPKLKIGSCFVLREIYYSDFSKFVDELMDLCLLETGNVTGAGNGRIIMALEEFNARRYFIHDPVIRAKIGPVMSRILQMNRKSLLKLTLEPNPNPNKAIQIPRLKNLKVLHFHCDKAMFSAFFPDGFQPSHTFPKLERVELFMAPTFIPLPPQHAVNTNLIFHGPNPNSNSNQQPESRISPDFLRSGERFETVQSLLLTGIRFYPPAEMFRDPGSGFFMKIRSMFPNLTRLVLNNSLSEISHSLCLQQIFKHLPQLQQLILEIDTDSRHGNLDAALTGIDVDLCKTLEKFVPCSFEGSGKEKLLQIIQSGRAISDLKELRILKFVLRSSVTRKLNKSPVLTPVTFEYGIGQEQLKNVRIFLDFHGKTSREAKADILTALEPVLPFMTVL